MYYSIYRQMDGQIKGVYTNVKKPKSDSNLYVCSFVLCSGILS